MQLRGGSSKGLYFKASDLPEDPKLKDKVLLAAMCGVGIDDQRQIDGLGGADPLTSKIAIVSNSKSESADLDYEFVQVIVGGGKTDRTQNCGNILAGVVPFALENGLIQASDSETKTRVFMSNSGSVCEIIAQTPNKQVQYSGDSRIDGVPGTAAPIICNYADTAGSACGSLFPTNNLTDFIDGIEITCIDNGMPVVLLNAQDFGITGYETREQLNENEDLKSRLEKIRLQAAPLMNLGDVREKAVPKMTLISQPISDGIINTRSFIPHVCHAAIGVLAAVSVATACLIPGTIAESLAKLPMQGNIYSVEHPSGELSVTLEVDQEGNQPVVRKAGIIRTARLISRGEVFIPDGIWTKD